MDTMKKSGSNSFTVLPSLTTDGIISSGPGSLSTIYFLESDEPNTSSLSKA